jgi:serine/threonine-protein kinase
MSLGTPTYVSPEQAAGDPNLDHRADIYSLGVLAYEMLTGHPPFAGKTPQLIFAAHAEQTPAPVSIRRPETPAPMAKLVMKCLAKQPAHRPQNAGDLVRLLRATPETGLNIVKEAPRPGIPGWVPWTIAAVATSVAIALAVAQ